MMAATLEGAFDKTFKAESKLEAKNISDCTVHIVL